MLFIKSLLIFILSCNGNGESRAHKSLDEPVAKKIPQEIEQHQDVRIDNYSWLRDKNWKKFIEGDLNFSNPEVKKYLDDEIAYTKFHMSDTDKQQSKIYNEILSRVNETDESYPVKFKNYYYYTRDLKGENYPLYCRKRDSIDGAEEIYFNPNKEAKHRKLYNLRALSVSGNNSFLAYAINTTGSMDATIKVRNLTTGKDLDLEIPDTTGNLTWDIDDKHLFYTSRQGDPRGSLIYRINIFEGLSSKKEVFRKPENRSEMFLGVSRTRSNRFLNIALSKHGSNEILIVDLTSTERLPKLIAPLEEKVEYSLTHSGEFFYILTNEGGANDFKVLIAPVDTPERKNWQIFLDEIPGTYKESIYGFKNFLVLQQKENQKARTHYQIIDLRANTKKMISTTEDAYAIYFSGSREYDTKTVRYFYQSPITPTQTIDYELETGQTYVRKSKKIPTYNKDNYEVRREFATAHDGELVPLTIMYKKGLKKDNSNKIHQYAYGSYGSSMSAYFSSNKISLLDEGFVSVVAHVRGGSDKGHGWYLDGKLMNKKNTFLDFISVSEHLIENGYTAKGKIVAEGGSAGGLLVGAVANMRPDLYCAIIADVPFVDVLNTMSDPSLPLTPPEWVEWGNPIKNKSHFEYIKSYSPYENIVAQEYPAMLFNSGISDEQVTYWEPTKMVAKLRDLRTDENLLLLNMKMGSGHSGASRKHESFKEFAFKLAFAAKVCR